LDDGTECFDSQSELATSKATGNEELPEVTPVAQEHIDNNVCKKTSAKRKLVFDTPKKRRRSIIANRAKRKRYKQNKYRWTKKDAERWKERAIAVESPLQGSRVGSPVDSQEVSVAVNASIEFSSIQRECELDGLHLFPEVQVSPIKHSGFGCTLQEKLSVCENEKKKLAEDSLFYRNLAEKFEQEKEEIKMTMRRRIVAVQSFWRNNVIEGRSRSGKILREAIHRKQ